MKKRSFWLVLFVGIFALSLGGCTCIQKQAVEETPRLR